MMRITSHPTNVHQNLHYVQVPFVIPKVVFTETRWNFSKRYRTILQVVNSAWVPLFFFVCTLLFVSATFVMVHSLYLRRSRLATVWPVHVGSSVATNLTTTILYFPSAVVMNRTG